MFVQKPNIKVGWPLICRLGFMSQCICMGCLCRWDGEVVHSRVGKLTRFPLPECWTGIEKEIVYIQMRDTRCLLFLPPVFLTLRRHDPVKWLFTCIRKRAKALLNELLSTIQLAWTSQQHNFPGCTMLVSAKLQTQKVTACLWHACIFSRQ